jgi:tRNA (guanine37-N1)-methyltransferase
MRVDILTLFPEMFQGPLNESLLKKAQTKGLLSLKVTALRDFATDKHKTADDKPYGGGAGMVMMIEPIVSALSSLGRDVESGMSSDERRIILMCPTGTPLTQAKVNELAKVKHLVIICGHYEGIDERVRAAVDEEISIGDYVLTGGELPAMVLVDAVARQIPGVVKEGASVARDSFFDGRLDYPSYTRPEDFAEQRVPDVLLSGHHAEIERWRQKMAWQRTLLRRPELLAKLDLTEADRAVIAEIIQD